MSRNISSYVMNSSKCKKQNRNSDIVNEFKEVFKQSKNNQAEDEYQAIDYKTAELVGLTPDTADKINRLYRISTQCDYENFHKQLYDDQQTKIKEILKNYQDRMNSYKEEQQRRHQLKVEKHQAMIAMSDNQSQDSFGSQEEDLDSKKQQYIEKMNNLIDLHNDALEDKDFKLIAQLRKEMIELGIQYNDVTNIKFLKSPECNITSCSFQQQLADNENAQNYIDDMDNSSCEIISIDVQYSSNSSHKQNENEQQQEQQNEILEINDDDTNQVEEQKQYESLTAYSIDEDSENA